MAGLFPHLPLFLDLVGRAAVLISGEAGLAPVARRLLDAGAGLTVVHPDVSGPMAALAPSARLLRRRWRVTDLDGAALVVAGGREPRAARARAAARAAGAIFTTLAPNDPSGMSFGAAISWGPVAIGVSASGLAPGLGEAVARRLEAAAPASYAGFLSAAARAQDAVARASPAPAERDAFWRDAAAAAFDAGGAGGDLDWDAWIRARLPEV
ncbi:MAG: hypothetical protein NW200_09385 [Hyphomonadaceae bacterium]|nr:hypothetical protein [Hyphomonadaceae bacterium]